MGKHEWFRWLVIGVPTILATGLAGAFMQAWAAGAIGGAISLASAFALSRWEQRHGPSREDLAEIRGLSDREATDFVAVFKEGLK